jgi:hypothetical protein
VTGEAGRPPPRPGWKRVVLRGGEGFCELPMPRDWTWQYQGDDAWIAGGADRYPHVQVRTIRTGCRPGQEDAHLRMAVRKVTGSFATWENLVGPVTSQIDGLEATVTLIADGNRDGDATRTFVWNVLWARPYGDVADLVMFTLSLTVLRGTLDSDATRDLVDAYASHMKGAMVGDLEGRTAHDLRH